MTNPTRTRCLCSTFAFGSYGEDGSAESYTDYTTGCGETTTRTFAMGHDAKLVGYMVRAEMSGEEIAQVDGGMRTTFADAIHAAAAISDALAAKTAAQLDAAKARVARKMAKVEVPAEPTHRVSDIKVGRWIYKNATINEATGEATYTPKLGKVRTVEAGKYTEVN